MLKCKIALADMGPEHRLFSPVRAEEASDARVSADLMGPGRLEISHPASAPLILSLPAHVKPLGSPVLITPGRKLLCGLSETFYHTTHTHPHTRTHTKTRTCSSSCTTHWLSA